MKQRSILRCRPSSRKVICDSPTDQENLNGVYAGPVLYNAVGILYDPLLWDDGRGQERRYAVGFFASRVLFLPYENVFDNDKLCC
jgi:hypothetical protein